MPNSIACKDVLSNGNHQEEGEEEDEEEDDANKEEGEIDDGNQETLRYSDINVQEASATDPSLQITDPESTNEGSAEETIASGDVLEIAEAVNNPVFSRVHGTLSHSVGWSIVPSVHPSCC